MSGERPAIPSKEELELIRDFCLLPMLLDIVEKNKKDMEYTEYTLKSLYIIAINVLSGTIHRDLSDINKELKRIKCKVNKLDKYDPAAVHFEFWLRGYHNEFGLMKEVVRSEMSVRLGKYIAGILKPSH